VSVSLNGERLILHAAPRARIVRFETQPPLIEGEPIIERYATAHKVIFEKHIYPTGKILWYKVKP
jgi:hypothetical protein